MKSGSIIKATLFACFLILAAHTETATAQGRDGSTYPKTNSSSRPFLDVMLSGSGAANIKNQMMEQMLFSTGSGLSWPPLPRAWVEYATTNYISSNTAVGYKLNPNVFGISATFAHRLVVDFRYQIKASFVLLVARDQQNTSMYKFSADGMTIYPDASEKRPMIGLCIFESQFAYERAGNMNFDLAGSGQSLNRGTVRTITSTHLSQFFQIDSSLSVAEYQQICQTTYAKKVQTEVLVDFSRQIMSFMLNNNPQSQCRPEAHPLPNESDSGCRSWFEEVVPANLKGLTLARCELQFGGAHRCVVRARKADVACPLYYDSAQGAVVTQRTSGRERLVSPAASDFPTYACDEASGLVCRVERQPWMIGGIPLRTGLGRCQPAASSR